MKPTHLLIFMFTVACAKGADEKGGKGGRRGDRKLEYPVDVAPLEMKTLQYSVTAPGSLEAFQQVQITARVAGAVDKVGFAEGEVVKVGQVLVQIESERYQITVDQARNALSKSRSSLKSAEAQLARRQVVETEKPGLIPGETIEQFATAVETAKADVETARNALRVAEVNLRDSYVKAPIPGVVQTRTVQHGQYLQAGAVLATILQRDPLLLRFHVTEQEAPRLSASMVVNIKLRESARPYTGKIVLVGGAADPQTRLVPVTAHVDATDHQYWLRPGAFCTVTVPIDAPRRAIVVPSLAVAPTDKGNVVYVIDKDNIARQKLVETGMYTPEGGVELRRGVAEGELLVVRGLEPLSEGAPVKVINRVTLDNLNQPTSQPAATQPAQDGEQPKKKRKRDP